MSKEKDRNQPKMTSGENRPVSSSPTQTQGVARREASLSTHCLIVLSLSIHLWTSYILIASCYGVARILVHLSMVKSLPHPMGVRVFLLNVTLLNGPASKSVLLTIFQSLVFAVVHSYYVCTMVVSWHKTCQDT